MYATASEPAHPAVTGSSAPPCRRKSTVRRKHRQLINDQTTTSPCVFTRGGPATTSGPHRSTHPEAPPLNISRASIYSDGRSTSILPRPSSDSAAPSKSRSRRDVLPVDPSRRGVPRGWPWRTRTEVCRGGTYRTHTTGGGAAPVRCCFPPGLAGSTEPSQAVGRPQAQTRPTATSATQTWDHAVRRDG